MEKKARMATEPGGLSKEEAVEALFGVLSSLHDRKKKRVHEAASPVVAAFEAAWHEKRARVAAKQRKRV